MKAPPRRNWAPDFFTLSAMPQICSSLSTEQGPAMRASPPAANLLAAGQGDDGVVGVELAVGLFVGLLHALDALHKILGLDILRVDGGGVADKAQHGAVGAHPGVHLHAVLAGEFLDEFIHHFLFLMGFEYDNHGTSLPFTK